MKPLSDSLSEELSTRTERAVSSLGAKTVSDLALLPPALVLLVKGAGRRSVEELRKLDAPDGDMLAGSALTLEDLGDLCETLVHAKQKRAAAGAPSGIRDWFQRTRERHAPSRFACSPAQAAALVAAACGRHY